MREIDQPHGRLSAQQFRSMRKGMRLSQVQLARLLGVSELTIGRWERKETAIPLAAEVLARTMAAQDINRRIKLSTVWEITTGLRMPLA